MMFLTLVAFLNDRNVQRHGASTGMKPSPHRQHRFA